jgi:frataxin-like iron-binding protein CyaY
MEDIIIYEKEGGGALAAVNAGQRAVLTQQTPKDAIKHRKGKGGKQFAYVTQAWVNEKLNEAFGWAWSWEIAEWRIVPNDLDPREVFVLGKLTVHTSRGDLVKTQFGTADVKFTREGAIISLGDDLKAASSDAMKKAASLLGIALDLYGGELDDDGDDAHVSNDPMTAYWAAAKAKGLTQAEGAALLKKHGNKPDKALKELAEAPAPQAEAPKATGNNSGQAAPPPSGKPATVGTSKWKAAADELAARCPYYCDANGKTIYKHMLGAAGKCGHDSITDENLNKVIADIEAYANKAANEAAQ